MTQTTPPSPPRSNRGVVALLLAGLVILAIAGVVLYKRGAGEPEPKPEPPKVAATFDIPAPLVVADKQPPISAQDAGPNVEVATDEQDPKMPKGKPGAGAEKPGTIDGKEVNRYINTHFGQVRTCYERRLKLNPLLEGMVDLNITINTKGKASSIAVNKDTVRDPQMLDCVKGVIRSWQLPQPEGGKVVIAKQFTFKKKI
jgi:hypothetical protein